MTLRRFPPRPHRTRDRPAYPRLLAAASVLLVSGCAIYPGNNSVDPGGDIALPFDEDTGRDARADTREDTKPDTLPDVRPDGTAAYPFDSGTAGDANDAGETSETSDGGPGDTDDPGEVQ